MTQRHIRWDGKDWQNHINLLLGMRYAPGQYQKIPDRVEGDCGLEGFTLEGTAFQCYAAEEPVDTKTLTEKQRDKITRDIGKLCKNHVRIAAILGSVRVHTWVMMVPRFEDKALLIHAAAKTDEVKSKKLPIVTDDFHVSVQDDSFFAAQKNTLRAGACEKVPAAFTDVANAEVDIWAAAKRLSKK